jgi:aryl-alcohol dehydrogenase-like predicted oxidoreductase
MRYTQLGRSGLTVSVVGLGCNNFGKRVDLAGTDAVVGTAIDEGITLLDTADVYGDSEVYLGKVLGAKRDQVVLATKVGSSTGGRVAPAHEARGGRRYLQLAVEASLRRLQTDRIDLLQLHEPDPATPIDETLATLDTLVRDGKVRYIGCSGLTAWQLVEAVMTSRSRALESFVSVQAEYSWINRQIERDLIPAAQHFGVGLIPYFPLANGLLTGKYHRGIAPTTGRLAEPEKRALLDDSLFDVVEELEAYAEEREVSLVQVAVAGLASLPGVVSVIAGATSPEQVRLNSAALAWEPQAEDMARLRALTDSRA